MLKLLHTADWHVGRSFGQFDPEDARKLARERLSVIDRILGLADQYDVHAVLCAGDLFDSPDPAETWWRGLADSFVRKKTWQRPIVLLPGNHDPFTNDSVYSGAHPFRKALPAWVHVVDHDDFELPLSSDAVVYAAPCTSTAGDKDLAMSLPTRCNGDTRVRIGLVHGSTFDVDGYQTNFPVSREAPRERGLDYLALGDLHGFREIPKGAVAPIVYPSAPEPTSFKEHDAGFVALVSFTRQGRRPRIEPVRVARWTWREEAVRSLAELEALAEQDLLSTVLRLKLEMTVSLAEKKRLDDVLAALKGTDAVSGRAGAIVCDDSGVRVEPGEIDVNGLPVSVRDTIFLLKQEAAAADQANADEAKRALVVLTRLLHEVF